MGVRFLLVRAKMGAMKRLDLVFLALRLPLDYAAVFLAALAAYFLRFQTFLEYRPATQIVTFPTFVALAAAGSVLWLFAFMLNRMYAPGRIRAVDEIGRIFAGCSTALVVLVLLIFFQRELFASRFIILAVWVLSMLFVFAERLLLRLAQTYLYKKGIGNRRVAVVGSGRTAQAIVLALTDQPTLGYTVVSTVPDLSPKSLAQLSGVRRERHGLEEIFLADAQPPRDALEALLTFADAHQVAVRYSADLLAGRRVGFDVAMFGGVPFVEIRRTPLEGWGRIYKRGFDVVCAAFLILVTAPLMLVIAAAVKATSPGPILFIRKRVGESGRLFPFLKFRSMVNAPQSLAERQRLSERPGIIPKLPEDGAWVTPVGRFIRRYSLDELPQLWNVLFGHMSLVGPRPHLPDEVAQYAPQQKKLLIIRPGMTGMAQISGRADLTFDDEAKLDLSYIERWSPKLDLSIILKTPLVVLSRKGAY